MLKNLVEYIVPVESHTSCWNNSEHLHGSSSFLSFRGWASIVRFKIFVASFVWCPLFRYHIGHVHFFCYNRRTWFARQKPWCHSSHPERSRWCWGTYRSTVTAKGGSNTAFSIQCVQTILTTASHDRWHYCLRELHEWSIITKVCLSVMKDCCEFFCWTEISQFVCICLT